MMSRTLLAALALSLGGCSDKGAAQATSTGPDTMHPSLDIKLVVDPTKLAIGDRGSFKIGFAASNTGAAPIDPQLHDAVLTSNGRRVVAWDLAIQNGARDASWTRLPPGKSIAMSWPLGDALFDKPGTYDLVLTLGAQRSAAEVEVTP